MLRPEHTAVALVPRLKVRPHPWLVAQDAPRVVEEIDGVPLGERGVDLSRHAIGQRLRGVSPGAYDHDVGRRGLDAYVAMAVAEHDVTAFDGPLDVRR